MIHYKNLLTINLKNEFDKNKDRINQKSPREHQVDAHKKMTDFFIKDDKQAGILVFSTGGGKTYTSIYWLLKNVISKNKKILWLADQGFLLEQARESFRENILEVNTKLRTEINIRIVSGSDRHANANQIEVSDDILLMTSQTAISHWTDTINTKFKKFLEANGDNLFIIYDEAHHTPAFGRRNLLIGGSEGKVGILEKYPNIKLLGLTATPTYTDKKKRGWLWEIFKGGIIYEVSKKDLQDRDILALPNPLPQKTNFDFKLSDDDIDKLVLRHQELPKNIVEDIAKNEERNHFIAQHYCDNKEKYGKTIIFLDRWYQCKIIEKYINEKAGKDIALSVFSYVDNNKNIDYINNRTNNQNDINLEKFKNGEVEVLLNIKMLTEGVDVPDVKTVFITRDTNSTILFTQMVGRALRGEKAGGNKTTANIVLFSDNWSRHIQFASDRFFGGKENTATKERGFRPHELISIDLLDKLEIEYQNQNYEKSIIDLVPVGWYVVDYTDVVIDEDDDDDNQKIVEQFIENVIVLENEESLFGSFIQDFSKIHKNIIWEKEELDLENAEKIISEFLESNDFEPNKATVAKLIQIARHLGQDIDNQPPQYYTFEQKEDINIMKYVLFIREKDYGRNKTVEYLEHQYYNSENSFLNVVFPDFESFYRAYEYEDNVYRRSKKGGTKISEASQDIRSKRLVEGEVRKIVFSRDDYKCLCCGKSNHLQTDHIISFKEVEPKDDDPNLYQTLCGVCNREKKSYSYNYRNTNFDISKMQVENILTTSSRTENPIFYFTRLINCYYKTNAVRKSSVEAKNHGKSIWKAEVKIGANPQETILKHKQELIEIIELQGFKLKDIEIIEK